MAETTLLIQQDNHFNIEFKTRRNGELETVTSIAELKPFEMLLASLGTCTFSVVFGYARNHQVNLIQARMLLSIVDEESNLIYGQNIKESIQFFGELSDKEHEKLFKISQQCTVHRLLDNSIDFQTELVEEIPAY